MAFLKPSLLCPELRPERAESLVRMAKLIAASKDLKRGAVHDSNLMTGLVT
jgi:hypothetical protein